MIELLNAVLKFWPLITGAFLFVLYIGALHHMVRSNNKAIARLFDDIDNLNKNLMDIVKENHDQFGQLVGRIDRLFENK
jgi:hypothetical protein